KQGENYVVDREAFGVAYAINEEGEFNEVWRTKGWYTFEGYLSEEGRYFVRMGPWASDQANHTDLAIAFYDRGKLLKQYQVRKLIKKTDLIENSVSHYNWRPQIQTEPNGFKGGTFHLVMIDKTAHSFDVSTGKLLTTEIDAGAKSSQEIRQEERQAAVKKGQALYEASSFKKDYQDHFHVEHLEADNGKIYGVWFKEPEWRADLTPKKKYTQQCEVRAVFPIAGPEEVDASISSAEIDTALQAALSHPFVSKRFKIGGATGLRLRITGDRLHWDTEELREHLAKLKKSEAKAENLRHWAELIIDAQKRQYISMFLNTETKELIYEDQSKWPWEPVLLDADNAGPDKINVDSPLDGIEVK
ncbi:MAG: hypothetical protein Q8M07_19935, partial [Prosthecobacter sp.]|nr:hypothetical protein [Prosthecobacter sp.]